MQLNENDVKDLDRIYRLNLINSITGVKPANLIGTISSEKQDNLAIFSSLVHLGSNPAQLGLVTRPQRPKPKDTYSNIKETGFYTINHISENFVKKAHYTSAPLGKEDSEFDVMNLERVFVGDFPAPFVAQSAVKIGMRHLESIDLPNGCILIIGDIVLIDLADELLNDKGQLELSAYDGVGISGLNSYYGLDKIATFPFVRVDEIPDFNE
jgi:flavin reductase (DIM6/NTAB) family NADH-FMN oxidoreductase RutF